MIKKKIFKKILLFIRFLLKPEGFIIIKLNVLMSKKYMGEREVGLIICVFVYFTNVVFSLWFG